MRQVHIFICKYTINFAIRNAILFVTCVAIVLAMPIEHGRRNFFEHS